MIDGTSTSNGEADGLDAELAALLRRMASLHRPEATGPAAPRYHPADEARRLRAVLRTIDGALPPVAAARIWHEIIACQLRPGESLPIAILAGGPGDPCDTATLARDHFGVRTTILTADSPHHALRLLDQGDAALAVLPMPAEERLWCIELAGAFADGPYGVIGRLPFVGAPLDEEALVVGPQIPAESGDDMALVAIEAGGDISRGTLRELLDAAGLEARWLSSRHRGGGGASDHLYEIAAPAGEARHRAGEALASVRAGLLQVLALGGYPRPVRTAGP